MLGHQAHDEAHLLVDPLLDGIAPSGPARMLDDDLLDAVDAGSGVVEVSARAGAQQVLNELQVFEHDHPFVCDGDVVEDGDEDGLVVMALGV